MVSIFIFCLMRIFLMKKKMQEMITQKQKEAEAVKESIQICKQEYEDYFHRFEQIKGQKITEKLWEDIQKKLQKLEKEKKESYQEVQQERENLQSLKESFEKLQKSIQESERMIEIQKERTKEFEELRKEYSAYEKNNKKLQECEKEEKRLENRQNLTEEKINILEEKYREFGTQENILFRENETLQNTYQKFAGYQKAGKNTEKIWHRY